MTFLFGYLSTLIGKMDSNSWESLFCLLSLHCFTYLHILLLAATMSQRRRKVWCLLGISIIIDHYDEILNSVQKDPLATLETLRQRCPIFHESHQIKRCRLKPKLNLHSVVNQKFDFLLRPHNHSLILLSLVITMSTTLLHSRNPIKISLRYKLEDDSH